MSRGWAPPVGLVAALTCCWSSFQWVKSEIHASEARLDKRIDQVCVGMQAPPFRPVVGWWLG